MGPGITEIDHVQHRVTPPRNALERLDRCDALRIGSVGDCHHETPTIGIRLGDQGRENRVMDR